MKLRVLLSRGQLSGEYRLSTDHVSRVSRSSEYTEMIITFPANAEAAAVA